VLFPGSLKLSRINWKARNEWEFIVNLKILQQAFQKSGVSKHIEVSKQNKQEIINAFSWHIQGQFGLICFPNITTCSFFLFFFSLFEIEKLARAKYQDNLEFAQWLKRFFDLSNGPNLAKDYDAAARRANQETEFGFLELRDNSRMAAMRQGRNDESADSKNIKWKIGARSKSPAVR
jgi:RP/EB family microtubule-associated protein